MPLPTTLPTPGLADAMVADLGSSMAVHRAAFASRFGASGEVRSFFSPGRVNLFGGHLDYNGGPVLPTAIDRGTFFALRPRADSRFRLVSTFEAAAFEGDLAALPERRHGQWYDYPLGVIRALAGLRRADSDAVGPAGGPMARGFDVLVGGNLPVGAGLSSSASICVGTAHALDRTFELGLSPIEWVEAALDAERGFVGVQCGIMDPFAVGFARPRRVLWLDCKDESYEHLPLDFEQLSIGVVDSGVQRTLARGEFNRRVAECRAAFESLRPHAEGATVLRDVSREVLDAHVSELDETVAKRARHVVDEVERTFAAREALLSQDFTTLGETMTATHRSFQRYYECSCEELDVLVDAAVSTEGVLGSRLTGAGFGGCVVMLVAAGAEEAATEGVQRAFEARYGRRPPVAFFQGDEGPREITE